MIATALALTLLAPAAKPIDLFDGKSLNGWHDDVPERDSKPEASNPFVVRDKMLVSLGTPMGHLISDASFENYTLTVEYRWPKGPGNSGVILHVSKLRLLNNFLPQGIEAQLKSGNAGDFHLFGETLMSVSDPSVKAGKRLAEGCEKPVGEWNKMFIECRGDTIMVSVNDTVVNRGQASSVKKGQIAIQSEGTEIEFRKIQLTKL